MRDHHVVQSRDCWITIATQYETSHQQIFTCNSYHETSLGVCPSILSPYFSPFGRPLRRLQNGAMAHQNSPRPFSWLTGLGGIAQLVETI